MISGVILTRKTPFLPANAYRRICGKRDLVVARYVLHLLGFGRTPEIDEEAVAHVVHRCRLRIAISAHRRDGHLASSFEHREDLLTQTRVHLHLRGTSRDQHISRSAGVKEGKLTRQALIQIKQSRQPCKSARNKDPVLVAIGMRSGVPGWESTLFGYSA